MTKPFLKWAGGKHRIAPHIMAKFSGECSGVYREPFAGSLALFIARATAGEVQDCVLSDANEKLINTYVTVRTDLDSLLHELSALPTGPNWEDQYYDLRDRFNKGPHHGPKHAALFIWLNRGGFNGLYWENQQGHFNVPVGRYKRPSIPTEQLFRSVSELLQRATLRSCCFREALKHVDKNDHIYCDPPYVPLSNTAAFTSYSKGGFNGRDQEELGELAAAAAKTGAKVVLSNHSTQETQTLYKKFGFNTEELVVSRSISSQGSNRNSALELLATSK